MKTSKLTAGMILLAVGSMFAVTAHAEEDTHSKQATTKAEASVKGGDLYLTGFTDNVNFDFDLNDVVTTDDAGMTAINSVIKSSKKSNRLILGQVVDLLGSNEKWTVNVKLSEFVNTENKEQKLTSPIIEGTKILGQETPKTLSDDSMIIDQVGTNIVSDGETTGLGVNTIGLSNTIMTFAYTMNKKIVAGDYAGEINWNLVDAETGQE
ncbi:WxL domain-containing protein [Candidatus Enterococcus ikei]|uniref:WxL domain-containing protein n=1 Tax=Candidatus Enterococcus ikei TaxID=2815326 RepID=A0ABS3H1L8_9ENTE|nr:WxL domain-containing protein [Enterococcus sp. DIV0869a]MBO0441422.1 WxL domain-containing protein [Enterococcus sp. DIV0869a]